MSIKFEPGRMDAGKWDDEDAPHCSHLVYMDVVTSDGHDFSGWVTPETHSLIHSAPDMLEALQRIANPAFLYSSDDDEDTQLSMRISDARAAIARATEVKP